MKIHDIRRKQGWLDEFGPSFHEHNPSAQEARRDDGTLQRTSPALLGGISQELGRQLKFTAETNEMLLISMNQMVWAPM